jgi:energy-coupling factor transporter ATP-binding protein EcfA2
LHRSQYRYHGVTDPALTDVTFTVAPGEHVVLLGSNGSGKSTLARLANGLLLPEEGTVSLDGMSTNDRAKVSFSYWVGTVGAGGAVKAAQGSWQKGKHLGGGFSDGIAGDFGLLFQSTPLLWQVVFEQR